MGYFSQVRPNYFLITPRFQPSTVRIPPLTVTFITAYFQPFTPFLQICIFFIQVFTLQNGKFSTLYTGFRCSTVRIPPLTVRVFIHNNLFSTLYSISANLYTFYSSFTLQNGKFSTLHAGFRCVSLAFSKKKRFFQPFMLEICGILTLAKKAWLASGKPNHICGVLYGVGFHLYSL